jgi:hypothetical protein
MIGKTTNSPIPRATQDSSIFNKFARRDVNDIVFVYGSRVAICKGRPDIEQTQRGSFARLLNVNLV